MRASKSRSPDVKTVSPLETHLDIINRNALLQLMLHIPLIHTCLHDFPSIDAIRTPGTLTSPREEGARLCRPDTILFLEDPGTAPLAKAFPGLPTAGSCSFGRRSQPYVSLP